MNDELKKYNKRNKHKIVGKVLGNMCSRHDEDVIIDMSELSVSDNAP